MVLMGHKTREKEGIGPALYGHIVNIADVNVLTNTCKNSPNRGLRSSPHLDPDLG